MTSTKTHLASHLISLIVSLILFNIVLCSSNVDPNRKLYIVYMGSKHEGADYSPREQHETILQSIITDSSVGSTALERSYGRTFDGFAAYLTDEEIERLNQMGQVLSVFPSYNLELQTTGSWDFLGFSENVTQNSVNGSDVIIGVIDSGIWAGSKSFSDEGFGPVPAKWKGACKGGLNFTCNRKIVGARYYGKSANVTDDRGHGTHTASTAAGNRVKRASFHDIAKGTARGGLPDARIAVYKVCNRDGCNSADLLAAFDDAIADGVDVITASIGSTQSVELTMDAIAIGSFHALANGVPTVNSAGNSGDRLATMTELAPWIISVGASTSDRIFVDKLILGNGKTFHGNIINPFVMSRNPEVALAYGSKNNTSSCDEDQVKKCSPGCLDEQYVKGKIVVCESDLYLATSELLKKGVAGLIMQTALDKSNSKFPVPAIGLTPEAFEQVRVYINSTASPTAIIRRSRSAKDPNPPRVARFSSRGPNRLFPDTMKPDVVAPGVNILAAFPPYIPSNNVDQRSVEYNFLSGTSMACPHVAGVVAYIKSQHPNWSPSALKSALMTSARSLNASMHPDGEFAYGSGLIDPIKATDPGLIYDISKDDYANTICSVYDAETCHKIQGNTCQCPEQKLALVDLNYPSMTAKVNASKVNVTFTRVVTNVGAKPIVTYNAQVTVASKNLTITVVPNTLSFKDLNEKQSFKVSVTGEYPLKEVLLSSSLVWSDGTHTVRSPIVLYTDHGDY
ncbi:unnamed protein product [Rhodiola kirilowii]